MSAVEEIQAAIDNLERRVKSVLGLMEVGADTNELYARVESDHDEHGDLASYGLNLTGIDSDEEINEAIVTLHRTIDAQMTILTDFMERYSMRRDTDWEPIAPSARNALNLARAINGGTQ